jgi:hypothetical protein
MPLLPNRSAVIDSSTTIVSVLVIPGSSPMRFSKARAVTERPPQKATSRPNREGASARLSCRQSWPLPPLAAALVPPLSRDRSNSSEESTAPSLTVVRCSL